MLACYLFSLQQYHPFLAEETLAAAAGRRNRGASSASDVTCTPIHLAKPFQIASHGVVGMMRPRPMFSGPSWDEGHAMRCDITLIRALQ